jgi:pyrroloquinoline quinone (PQQ) biosynthesis protein C
METATFHAELTKLVAEHKLDQHPYVKLVNQGGATREQLKGYPI